MVPWRSPALRSRAQRVAIDQPTFARRTARAGEGGGSTRISRTKLPPRVEVDNYKASYLRGDECGRDLGYSNHGARTFAQPPKYGQCRHHSLAFQRVDVLCWAVRLLLHRAGAGGGQLAAAADRAEPVPGGAGHAGADRLVVHLPDGRFRSRARRRVRAAPLGCADLCDGVVLRARSGLRVPPPDEPRDHDPRQRLRQRVLPGHRFPRVARHRRADRLHLPAGAHHDEQVHPGAGHRVDRRLLLLALRRHRLDRTVRHDLFHPLTSMRKNRSARLKKLGLNRSLSDRARRRLRRRLSAGLLLVLALVVAGGLAAVLTPSPQVAVADESSSALLRTGKQRFDTSCVTCHGATLQGVPDRGPSLIGVGEAAVYFQVSSGRRPAMRGEAQVMCKEPIFDESQIDALGAYVQANGGGPTIERNADGSIAMTSLRGGDLGRGGDLFRLNCSSCHNFTGKGGALSSGKFAPELEPANEQQILDAMRTGPQNMPKFSDRQLSFDAKKDLIAYVKNVTEARSPGGNGLGGFGPAPEGMVAWIVGMVAVIGAALWIGARS